MRTIAMALVAALVGACSVDDTIIEGKSCKCYLPDQCISGYSCLCNNGVGTCLKNQADPGAGNFSLSESKSEPTQASVAASLRLLRRQGVEFSSPAAQR